MPMFLQHINSSFYTRRILVLIHQEGKQFMTKFLTFKYKNIIYDPIFSVPNYGFIKQETLTVILLSYNMKIRADHPLKLYTLVLNLAFNQNIAKLQFSFKNKQTNKKTFSRHKTRPLHQGFVPDKMRQLVAKLAWCFSEAYKKCSITRK